MPNPNPPTSERASPALSEQDAAALEHAARLWEMKYGPPPPPRWANPGALAREIHPKTVNTPALDLIDDALVNLGPDERLIITMAPQEGKSQRVAHDFILWWLEQHNDARCAVASYGQSLATRNGLKVRRSIENYDLGLSIASDNGSAGEWELEGHEGGLFSVGIGGPFGGKPVDLLVIDDPIKDRKEADSPVFRQAVWEWWTDVASARLGPGAPVVLILTRWHDDDLAGRLLAEPDAEWKVLNIKAQADHRPELGETDILDRQPGEFMLSARGRTQKQWEQRKKTAGARSWQALYQGDPAPSGGLVFNPEDIRFWTRFPLKASPPSDDPMVVYLTPAEIAAMWQAESWDLTFTGASTSDFVAGQRWGGRGSQRFLLSRRHAQLDFTASIDLMLDLAEEQPTSVTVRLVEKAANGAAALSTLKGVVGGLRPVKPTESKEARAIAVTPQFEAHDVYFPDPTDPGNEWVYEVIEEFRLFPTGKHDDEVDSCTQLLNWARNRGLAVAAQPMSAWERPVDVQRVG